MPIELPDDPAACQKLRDGIQAAAGSDWCHEFEFSDDGRLQPTAKLSYRVALLREVFQSLFRNRSVLVLDECSGFYPTLIRQAGARLVRANNASPVNCGLMAEFSALTGEQFEVLPQSLVAFEDPHILVDLELKENHEFMFAQNRIWDLYNGAGQSFADVVEACSHYVTEGLVFDWTDAAWASPPPPQDYRRETFQEALLERFEYVLRCTDWLIVALGKLPVAN